MPLEGLELDPGIVGPNVAAARRRKSLNQTDLAKAIGVSRPIIVAIESGQRTPSESVLAGLADALQVRIRDLVTLPAADERALVRFRDPLRAVTSASSAVNALVDFGRYYRLLEQRSGKKFRSRSVPPIAIEELSDKEHAATDLAVAERARLNLGDGPLLDVRAVLEQDAGVLVFGLRSLEPKVAGLFTYSLDLPLVGFNSVESDVRRQRWTLAHEYAHFLTNRYDAEITYEERKSRDAHEVFADRFATHFLMPASGVSRRLSEITGGGEKATVAHVLLLADQFRVSFQAMCERLEGMGRIPKNTYDHVMSRGFRPIEAERSLGIERRNEHLENYPVRYTYLLSVLWREGLISEGDVATYLQTDRLSSREVLDAFEADTSFPIDVPLESAR